MKKSKMILIIISLLIFIILLSIVIILINKNNNKVEFVQDINVPLKVTKVVNDNTKDSYLEMNIVNFERGFATTIETIMVFNNKEAADMMYEWQKHNQKSPYNTEMKVEKNELIVKTINSMSAYSKYYIDFSGSVTRRDIKNVFERKGYVEEV